MSRTIRTLTSSQTVGPFFHGSLLRADARRSVLVTPETVGERIRVEGRVLDGDGVGVSDAMVEIWQANAHGRYDHPADRRELGLDASFLGFGRSATNDEGAYQFDTIRPGRVPYTPTRLQAPHITVAVFARGLLNHLYTRVYLADDPTVADDPILQLVPVERRSTLLGKSEGALPGIGVVYRFDIVLQGKAETVFFNLGTTIAR